MRTKNDADVEDRCHNTSATTRKLREGFAGRHVRYVLVRRRLHHVQHYTARHQQTQGKVRPLKQSALTLSLTSTHFSDE